jgi:putative transposase
MKQGLLTISAYIEGFYNRERRHTTLGNLSPADYESQHAAVCLA